MRQCLLPPVNFHFVCYDSFVNLQGFSHHGNKGLDKFQSEFLGSVNGSGRTHSKPGKTITWAGYETEQKECGGE